MSERDRTAAERQKRCRQRKRKGVYVAPVEIDLEAALDAGLLTDEESRDAAARRRALSRAFHEFILSRVTARSLARRMVPPRKGSLDERDDG